MASRRLPSPVKLAYEKLTSMPSPPWLAKPLYYRFMEALNPSRKILDTLDPYQQGVWLYAYDEKHFTEEYECVRYALSYRNSQLIRSHLNALFFGGASIENVAEFTSLDLQSVDAFKRLFCEIEVFEGARLLQMEYIQQLPELEADEAEEKKLYRMAMDFGWKWVVWKISRGMDGHKPGVEIVDTMVNLAFWRALEGSASPLNSPNAKEGRQYMKLASQMAIDKHRSKMGEINDLQDLILKLTAENPEDYEKGRKELGLVEKQDELPELQELLYEKEKED